MNDSSIRSLIEVLTPMAEHYRRTAREDIGNYYNNAAADHLGIPWTETTTVRRSLNYVEAMGCGKRLGDLLMDPDCGGREGPDHEDEQLTWESLEVDGSSVPYVSNGGVYLPVGSGFGDGASVMSLNSGSYSRDRSPYITLTVNRTDRQAAQKWLEDFVKKSTGMFNVLKGRILSAEAVGGLVLNVMKDVKTSTREDLVMDQAVWDVLSVNAACLTTRNEELRNAGLSTRRGVLLEGRPGVGKSHLCRAFAEELNAEGVTVIHVSFRVAATALRVLFDSTALLGRCVIILDDIDLYLKNRREGDAAALSDFLSVMDGAAGYNDVLVLGTTNDRTVLDAAAIRSARFDRVLVISNPTPGQGALLLDRLLDRAGVTGVDSAAVVDSVGTTSGLDPMGRPATHLKVTGADLQAVVRQAILEVGVAGVTTSVLIGALRTGSWNPAGGADLGTGQYL